MKKIVIAVSLLSIINSCTTGSGSGTSVTPLNSTETQLVGTWYLNKESGAYPMGGSFGDTTFTGYNSSYYLTFKSDKYAAAGTPGVGDNYKQAISSWAFPTMIAPMTTGSPVVNTNISWYYDNTTSFLQMSSQQFSIVSVSGSALVLKHAVAYGSGFDYFYFSK